MSKKLFHSLLEKEFLVIAHRGASKYAPENTMAAFTLASKMNADMIELDVQLSKDGVPVVFHDAKLNKHSNGKGKVSSFLFDELRQLDAGKWFSREFIGEKIPSLEEVLKWASGTMPVNIEIKKEAVSDQVTGGVEEKVVQLIHKHQMSDRVIVSSFSYRAIERIKEFDSRVITGLLYDKESSGNQNPLELMERYRADLFHCSRFEMTATWRDQLEKSGKKYLVYTINRRTMMRKWIELGAFGIFSDKPDQLKALADNHFQKSA